jgi:DNA-binding SARP family transcriptional activator/tetratricopeptide (TPR) repeat protein
LRLRTIGGLWIEAESLPPLRPRPLGLLALVAAAGKRGVSRDRVVGILWAETPEEQARHTLSQTLYNLRRSAGRDLIVGTSQLRLDPSVTSDIGDLKQAVIEADLETVGALYTGKFLEGFYLPGASEFEHWVEEERAGLHREALRAIEQLAKRADETGRNPDAIRWWHQLAELDPLSARYTAGYMRALTAVGDQSGALGHARLYRETVHRELNAEPDPAVRQLEQSIRTTNAAPVSPAVLPAREPEVPGAIEGAKLPAAPLPRSHPAWLVPVAFLLLIVAGLAVRSFGSRSASARPFLAVGDIHTLGGSDSTAAGSILRDMLSTSLGGLEGLQVVANSRLVELMPPSGSGAAGVTADAARRAGATELIEGELTAGGDGLMFSLRRVALSSGVVRKGYLIRAADRYAIVDSATAAIARDLRLVPPPVTVAQIRTTSPVAYAFYEEGLRANYGWDGAAAYRLMKAALERDSGFAMAAFYVWQLSRGLADGPAQALNMARAKRLAARTIERERLLIMGSIAEVDAPLRQALAVAETLTVKYPSDPEGHILLGNVEGRAGNWAASVAAYNRAVALDSTAGTLRGPYCRVCDALGGMGLQYLWWDSAGAAERSARRLLALRPAETNAWSNMVEPLLRQGRFREAVQAQHLSSPDSIEVGNATGFFRDAIRWGRYAELEPVLRETARSLKADTRSEAWWLLMLNFRDQGRLREADSVRRVWREANIARGDSPADQPADAMMIAMERGHPEISIRSFRNDADRTVRSNSPPGIRNRYLVWFLALAGTVHAEIGDTTVVRRLADSLELLGQTSQFGRDAKLHYFLRGLLYQNQRRDAEAVEAFQRSLFSLTDGYTRINLMMAGSLLALHRPAEAIAVLRPAIRGGVDGSNTYTSRTELHEAMAQAFEQAGQADSARFHWRAVEAAWRKADPQFRERYLVAKQKAGL